MLKNFNSCRRFFILQGALDNIIIIMDDIIIMMSLVALDIIPCWVILPTIASTLVTLIEEWTCSRVWQIPWYYEIPLSVLQGISVWHNLREDHGQQTTTWSCKGRRRKSIKIVGGSCVCWFRTKLIRAYMNIISFVNMIAEMLIKKELEHFVPRSWVWVGVGWTSLRQHIQTPGSQRSRGTDIAMRQSCGE